MAINKKLIHFKLKSTFESELEAGNILDTSIVFIQDANLIWTHGTYYCLPKDEILISEGIEPTDGQEIWIDLSEDSTVFAVEEAPKDGKQYVRENGKWVEIPIIDLSNYLAKDNTEEYTLTSDYNPAIKKYVDDYNLMPKSNSQIVHTPSAGSFDKKYTVDDNDGKFSKVTILGNDNLPYDSFIILNDLSAYNIGDIVYTNIYKEDNDTIKYTVFATRDSFSISFELIECFYEGINSVTTLVNLPATKRSIVATVTAATSLSLASNLELGQELYIRIYNNSSSAITQPIPNSGNFVSMNGTSVSIPSKSFIEMSIWCYESSKYSIRIGEIA